MGCVSVECGVMIWSCNVGGVNGIGGDVEYIYGVDGFDCLSVWCIVIGDIVWMVE